LVFHDSVDLLETHFVLSFYNVRSFPVLIFIQRLDRPAYNHDVSIFN